MMKKSISKRQMLKRTLAVVLALAMMITGLPVTALAETAADSSKDYPVAQMTYTAGSEELTKGLQWNEGPVRFAFDENEATLWHSDYEKGDVSNGNFWVEMKLAEATYVDAVRYLPGRTNNGDIGGYKIEGTADGEAWTLLTEGTWEDADGWKIAEFEAVEVVGVRLTATSTYSKYEQNVNGFANAKEIRVRTAEVEETVDTTALAAKVEEVAALDTSAYTDETAAVLAEALTAAQAVLANAEATQEEVDAAVAALEAAVAALIEKPVEPVEYEIDSAVLMANAKANSEQLPAGYVNDGGAEWAFDDNEEHWWHSRYQNWDQVGAHEVESGHPTAENPIWIQTGFGEVVNVTKVTYATRQGGNGAQRGKDYSVAVANLADPTAEPTDADFTVVKSGVLENTGDEQTIVLDAPVAATHVRITFTSVYESSGTAEVAARKIRVFATTAEVGGEEEPEDPTIEVSERVQGIMDAMTLKEKVSQMMMVDFRKWGETGATAVDFTEMNETVSNIISEYDFGSIILFANNIKETEQSFNLTLAMQEAATKDGDLALLITADQEGGSVYRLGSGTALPGNMALGATGDTNYSYEAGKIIGSELQAVGINANLAPVVDVNNNANNPVIGLRSYGDDATAVGQMAAASIQGMAEYNVIGCAKHFPGHGDTATDSHYGLPIVDKSLDVLLENELKPYEVAIDEGIEMIMTAHILYPQLEGDKILSNKTGEEESLPATMSDDILTGLLKGDMGFEGIIVSDAMNMNGISGKWDQVQSVKVAIAAGLDMVCMPCQLYCEADLANLDAIINGVVEAVENGEIPETRIDDAVARILTVKENRGILDYKAEDHTLENALATVGSAENRQTEREIASAAVTVVKNDNNVLPLNLTSESNVLMLVPYNNERAQMLMGWNRAVEAGIIPYGAEVDYFRFSKAAIADNSGLQERLEWADVVIMNSEISNTSSGKMKYGSFLSALPNAVADYCKENGKTSVIVSVDKPYDVQLYPNADAILAAYGCKGSTVDPTEALIGGATGSVAAYGPNIIAGVEVALGTFGAQGTLPVNIPVYDAEANTYTETIAYARGYGLTYEAKAPITVDTTALQAKVDEYKAVLGGEGYYVDSLKALKAAIKEAEALMADAEATQYEVEAMAVALDAAFAEAEVMPSGTVEIDPAVLAANAKANSEHVPTQGNDGGAAWAFDEEAHWWHSRWGGTPQEHEVASGEVSETNPIWIQTGFDEEVKIASITYLPRYDNGYGRIANYTVSVANLDDPTAEPTDEDFTVVKTGTLENIAEEQTITLDELTAATHVRITATSVNANGGTPHVAAQNIKIYAGEEALSRVDYLLSKMSVREKVSQMMMVDFRKWGATNGTATDFTEMNAAVSDIISRYDFGSIILFANNIKETAQSYNLTMAMQEAATKDGDLALLISADQEGGSVYRLGSGTALPGNMALGATFDAENALKAGQIIGSELNAVGINTNLAPVVDVNNNANNPVIGLRSYGDDATAVGEMAAASIQGMAQYNVIGCAKHFPGHGDTATDSHYGLPMVDKSLEVLLENELKPYEVAINEGIEMIMTAHILYPQLEGDKIVSAKTGEEESLPATMSDDILTGLLKEQMGFEGIIVSDAMNMAGISAKWDQVQSVKVAIAAGLDMVCMPCQLYCEADLANLDAIIDGVVEAVESGEIPESRIDDAVTRILTVKENRGILDYDPADHTLENAEATVGSDENRQTEREIAAKAVTVVKNEGDVLPLDLTAESKVLMLCPYNNETAQLVMGWNRAVEAGIIPEGAAMDYYRFSSESLDDAGLVDEVKAKIDWADTVIVVTEVSSTARMAYKHWLSNIPNAIVNYADAAGKVSVIMSADKPYDVQMYPNADAVMAVYGCKGSSVDPTEAIIGGATGSKLAYGPNIIAGVEVALGTFGASGKLPVNIPVYDVDANAYTEEIVYARGYGLTYDAKEPIVVVDKTVLEGKVTEYEAVDTSVYTDETAAAFADALAAAQAVLANEEATQEEVNAALATLEGAYAALEVAVVEPQYIPVENFAGITAGDEELINSNQEVEGPVGLAIDGNEGTFWHTDWYVGDNHDNHWLQIELDSAYLVSGFEYLPRQSNGSAGNTNGTITSYKILVSEDGENWVEVAAGDWAADSSWKSAEFDAVKAKYVRLKAEAAESDIGIALACAAEVKLLGAKVTCAEHTTELRGAVEATCASEGYTGDLVCTNCLAVVEKGTPIEALPHTEVVDEAVAPTCTESGLTEGKHCSVCDTVIVAQEVVEATGHEFGEWKVVKEATCGEAGSREAVCAACGEKVTEEIPALDHTWGEWKVVKEATCAEAGSEERVCTTCNEKETREIEILDHTWGEWTVVKAATAKETGLEERVCTVCGEKEEREIPMLDFENPFVDVPEDKWYYNAVMWGAMNDIVAGITDTEFYPTANSTRAQIVSLLWRASGRPEPTTTECKFTDVNSSKWYYKAVLWATEKGYVAGYTDTTFVPDATCKRAEMATFLWRMAGKPVPEGSENPFFDVPAGKWYETAAQWAYESGIVSGYELEEGTAFAPDNQIARGETVTMLYRYFKDK